MTNNIEIINDIHTTNTSSNGVITAADVATPATTPLIPKHGSLTEVPYKNANEEANADPRNRKLNRPNPI